MLLTKGLVAVRITWLPETYKHLMETVSRKISPRVHEILLLIHNQANYKKKTSVAKQAKCVPALIFQMEQLDLQFIKLAVIVTKKSIVSQFILRTSARDFQVKEIEISDGEDGEEAGRRKKLPRRRPPLEDKENASNCARSSHYDHL